MKKPPIEITRRHLPVNAFSNPGYERQETLAVSMHWVGNSRHDTAHEVEAYFRGLGRQNKFDEVNDIYASSNYAIGVGGEVLELIRPGGLAYTSGGAAYTRFAQDFFGPRYTSNKGREEVGGVIVGHTPNWASVSIELCHPTSTGEFTSSTLVAARTLVAWLLKEFNLKENAILRHYDITGKPCPRWWVGHQDDFEGFRSDVGSLMSGDGAW